MTQLTISARMAGRAKPLVPDWSVPWPPEGDEPAGGGGPLTLRDLITRIVLQEVDAFRRRQQDRRLARVLTVRQMERGLERGRVDSGGRDLMQDADDDDAVAAALQAFEDGIYLVVLDGQEQRELDRQVYVRPDSQLVFLRLVMLAGG